MPGAIYLNVIATACFAFAILHTFLVKQFHHIARKYPADSIGRHFFHLIGEVEIVFGLWSGIYLLIFTLLQGHDQALHYLETRNFTEPTFVFVIMTLCSTRPVLEFANRLIDLCASLIPLKKPVATYFVTLTLGPILGSFITEPAAMTVTALTLLNRYYEARISRKLKYATLGLLFVNVSIGGSLTPYAAPPVIMVARPWNWDLAFMLANFGWKALLAILISTSVVALRFRSELSTIRWERKYGPTVPIGIGVLHLVILVFVIINAHHPIVFIGAFLFFLGLVSVTKEYQTPLKLREPLLVAFFLGGLIILGGPQRWWLEPILNGLTALPLYLGATALTSITDNAALTYLGSQVPNLAAASRYALVAGSLVGGGLTVIANAPNPAGYGILNPSFGDEGISPLLLFTHALVPTLVAALCFWML